MEGRHPDQVYERDVEALPREHLRKAVAEKRQELEESLVSSRVHLLCRGRRLDFLEIGTPKTARLCELVQQQGGVSRRIGLCKGCDLSMST